MAEITVKCVNEFFDKENKIKRNTGDIFMVTEERAAQIREYESTANKKYIEEVQEPPAEEIQNPPAEATPEQSAEEAPKAAKRTKKAAGDES